MPRGRPPGRRSARPGAPRTDRRAAPASVWRQPSVVVEPLLDQLLRGDPTRRIEAAVLEELFVLEVDVVLPAAILLDRGDDPVAIPLRLVRIKLDVDLGDDVVLVVQDQDDVGL